MSRKFIQEMFPAGELNGRGGTEVNGLPAGSEPQGVDIIARWNDSYLRNGERREYFHVTNGQHSAYLRVCSAMAGSGYDEFVVIHAVAEVGSPEDDNLKAWATRSHEANTR